jgi:ABC-2 type transport system permease protein
MATTTAPLESSTATAPGQPARGNFTLYTRAFAGLLLRDLYVLRRELFPFAIRVAMNPLLFLFVFTYVFPHMSGGPGANPMAHGNPNNVSFSTVLLPGLMAVAIMFSGIAAVALPLAQEFGITREIDDRVMCPLPVPFVAFEKIFFSALQSVVAACIVFPLAIWIPSTPAEAHIKSWPFLILVLVLASLVSGALGLTIGTSVKPQQIGLIFGVVVVPITFLGCVYYPWAALNSLPILQHAILINPIVYMSEGLRSALTPSLGHMNDFAIIGMLLFFLFALGYLGMRGFLRRVIS